MKKPEAAASRDNLISLIAATPGQKTAVLSHLLDSLVFQIAPLRCRLG